MQFGDVHMKRLLSVLCCIIFLFSFVGCANKNDDYTEHQDLEKNEISFFDDMLHFNLKEAGLENVFIRDMSSSSVLVGDDLYAHVYLIGDDRYRGNMSTSDHYLMLITEDKIILGGDSAGGGLAMAMCHYYQFFQCS